jgi:glutathione S-transferase
MLTLYGRNSSGNVQKATWALGELGFECERIDEDGNFGSIDTPEYRTINPNARIPTLIDNGHIVRQSNTIVRYLFCKHSRGDMWPEELNERTTAEEWMDWASTENAANMFPVFWGLIRTKPEDRDMAAIEKGIAGLNQDFSILNDHLAGKQFVAGERFTMGDIPVGVNAYRYLALDIKRPPLRHLEAWYQRLTTREPYRTHIMLPLS